MAPRGLYAIRHSPRRVVAASRSYLLLPLARTSTRTRAMSNEERVVYFEDLEDAPAAPASSQDKENSLAAEVGAADATAGKAAVSSAKPAADAKAKSGTKRQRTLVDMFTAAPAQSAAPAAKKIKLAGSAGALARSSSTLSTASGSSAVAGASQSLNSIPFSLSAYRDGLSAEEKTLLALECETLGLSWLKVLKDEIRKPYFLQLKRFLGGAGVKWPLASDKGVKVFPAPKNIYAWSNLTPLGRVKVVVIGQDPYHGPGQAHGLCFSVPPGVAVPPSLRNIYQEIRAEYPEFEPPKHGNLTAWAENGVLLLNTCLTVRAGEAGSHSGRGWEDFTDRVVDVVDRYGGANLSAGTGGRGRGIVFLAWGAWAAKRVAKLDKKKHLILSSAHPSPLSASRGFFGNGHFKKANDWLEEKYGPDARVDWCKL